MTFQTWVIVITWGISKAVTMFVFCEPFVIKYNKKIVILTYAMGSMLFYIIRAYFFIHTSFALIEIIFHIIILPVFSYMVLRFSCDEKTMKIIVFETLIFALGVLAQLFSYNIYYLVFGEYVVFDFIGNESMYTALIALFAEISLYLLFFFIWKRYIGKMRLDIPNAGAFLLIIGGQLIYTMNRMLAMLHQQNESQSWSVIGMIFMIIGNLAILQILLTNSKKKEIEDNLKEIQHIRELEQMHYTAIEERRQELAKVRHDFNNQLAAAHQLIISNKKDSAEKLLDELEQSIDMTTEYVYCENAIVNAVFIEKKKECDSAEITLETDIIIPDNCGISQLHLCSIFTNLLDNAIRACKNTPIRQRKIEIRTAFKGRYLHIKCVNPFADEIGKERSRKGYGKIILSDIAGYYNGNFTTEKTDGTYNAVISLLCMV